MTAGNARFDVVVVGGRCAGAAVAASLARRGVEVAVVEQACFPRDTLSSHIFEADALAFLDGLGLTARLQATRAPFVNRTDLRIEGVRIEADWPVRQGDPGGLMSVRRFVLDPILAHAAEAAGADVRMGARVVGLMEEDERVAGVRVAQGSGIAEIRARLVVGADGRRSTVARLAGAHRYNVTANQRASYWRYYEDASSGEPTFVSHRWGERFVLAIPSDGGLYQVLIWPQFADVERHRGHLGSLFDEAVCGCDPIESSIADARPVGKIQGARRWEGFFRDVSGPGWVLVGDAGHFKDPGPGRGIGDAFIQARSLAPAIEASLHGPASDLDKAMRRWGKWRDDEFADHYWFAADTSAAGGVPAVLPELLRQLHESGEIGEFLELINHRRRPAEVLTAPRILRAAASAVARRRGDRLRVLRELGDLLAEDRRRRRRNRRPVYAGPSRQASAGRLGCSRKATLPPKTETERT